MSGGFVAGLLLYLLAKRSAVRCYLGLHQWQNRDWVYQTYNAGEWVYVKLGSCEECAVCGVRRRA